MSDDAMLAKLDAILQREDLSIKPSNYLRTTFRASDGSERPLRIRNYQIQMIMHLLAMKRFVVGDDCGLGKCVSGDTMVATDRGLQRIEDMHDWTEMGVDEFQPPQSPLSVVVSGELRPVVNFYRGGVKPTVTVMTRYGFQNTGSYVHPIMVRRNGEDQWVKMSDLRVGDHVCVDRSPTLFPKTEPSLPLPDASSMHWKTKIYDVPNQLNPDLARLLGYIVAEGWTNHRSTFVVSQDRYLNTETWEDIRQLLLQQLHCEAREPDHLTLQINSLYLREYLKGVGVPNSLSANKMVPWSVMQGSRESVRQFLRGFFEGEGSVVGGVELSSASQEMLKQIQVLLLRFGIVAKRTAKKVKGRDHIYWRLTIFGDDARLFQDAIGFVSTRKVEALAAALDKKSNPNHDVIPGAKGMVEDLRTEIYARAGLHGGKGEGIVKRWGVSFFSALSGIRFGRRDTTYHFLKRMIQVSDELGASNTSASLRVASQVQRGYFYDPVVSVEHGEHEVFDVEVGHPDHSFIGNGFVNHNTLSSIASCAYLWDKGQAKKVVVLTKKSVVNQWADEVDRFTVGTKAFVVKGTPKQRAKVYEAYKDCDGPSVLVMGYRSAVQDFEELQNWRIDVLVLDEVTMVKNPSSRVHQIVQYLASEDVSTRVWGLTATLIKNNLIEGYGIYRVIVPGLFHPTETAFMNDFCIVQMQPIGKGRKVPVIVGYRRSDIERFKATIRPYYLGRPKHAVAKELPVLTTKIVHVGMSGVQHMKYAEALSGLLVVGDDEKEVSKLTAVTYCQEIVNHPSLIQCDGESEKLDTLIDMLTDGELEGEKVIVYTRFERMVKLGMDAMTAAGVKSVRITGAESEDQRAEAQRVFQDHNSDVKVIWITNAGNDAINLQTAKALVFFDTPFSAGDLLQTIGRMVRIGSIHDRCFVLHLVAKDTIDERVMAIQERKMGLVEAILGKRILGDTDTKDEVLRELNEIDSLFAALKEDAKGLIRG